MEIMKYIFPPACMKDVQVGFSIKDFCRGVSNMNKIYAVLFAIFLILNIFLSGCAKQPKLPIDERRFLVGTAGFVPRNYPNSTDDDWKDFFDEVLTLGEVFGAYFAWDDTDQIETAAGIELNTIFAVGYNIEAVNDSYFEYNREGYRKTILNILELYSPEYIAIGVEVNSLIYKVSQHAFNEFVDFYIETYDVIKEKYPSTKVFTIFQLEMMKGKARLMGLDLEPHWSVIQQFQNTLDVIGFTTYPFLEYESVYDIPNDYYLEIVNFTDTPIAFTEMGWPTNSSIVSGYEIDQVKFFLDILNATKYLDVELFIHPFLHDASSSIEMFQSIGLKTNNGREKLIYNYWQALVDVPIDNN